MRLAIACLVIGLCLFGTRRHARAQTRRLVVVVAKGSPIKAMTRAELRRCFTSEPMAAGGKPVIPFNAPPNSAERTAFDYFLFGMAPDQIGRFWVDRKVRGQSTAPRSLPSLAYAARVAAKFPGAITYLFEDQLTSDIQPVAIDGVAYTDRRYPLIVEPTP